MGRSSLAFIASITLVFIIFININTSVQSVFLEITDNIKLFYINGTSYVSTSFNKYLNQSNEIARLDDIKKENEKLKIENLRLKSNLGEIKSSLKTDKTFDSYNLDIAEVISYANLADPNKVWLDLDSFKEEKNQKHIYGLISSGYAAGIVVSKNGRAMGLLNGDKNASYSVYIGDNKATGIIRTSSVEDGIFVDFIPIWENIKKGDMVYTSGLDGIFFDGIKVGVIESVQTAQGYKIAKVDIFLKNKKRYYWVTKNTKANKLKEEDVKEHR